MRAQVIALTDRNMPYHGCVYNVIWASPKSRGLGVLILYWYQFRKLANHSAWEMQHGQPQRSSTLSRIWKGFAALLLGRALIGTWACNGTYHWRCYSNGKDSYASRYPNVPARNTTEHQGIPGSAEPTPIKEWQRSWQTTGRWLSTQNSCHVIVARCVLFNCEAMYST